MSHPFPEDPLGRAWIEVSGANPVLVDQYRPALVAFLALDRDHSAYLVGTGFVTCGNADMAIVITARHVLEGVARVQRPSRSAMPRLGPHDLRAIWMGTESAGLLNVIHASFNPETEVAAC